MNDPEKASPDGHGLYEWATSGNSDPRTEDEVANDLVDPHLIDVYQSHGLFEAPLKTTYIFTAEEVMDLIRAGWAAAMQEASRAPKTTKRVLDRHEKAYERAVERIRAHYLKELQSSLRTDLGNLPITDPNDQR